MDLVCLILFLSSPVCLVAFAVMAILGLGNQGIPLLAAFCLLAPIGLFGFRFSVILGLKRFRPEHFKLSRKIAAHLSTGEKSVFFEKKRRWVCTGLGKEISFDLRGIVFKKAFLSAFVTRALRYRVVSAGLPHASIARFRLKGTGKSLTAFAEFRSGKITKRILLAEDGVSKPKALPWFMIYCCAPQSIRTRWWKTHCEGARTGHYDETSFCLQFINLEKYIEMMEKHDDD